MNVKDANPKLPLPPHIFTVSIIKIDKFIKLLS
jgi:hypothetical protein